MNAGGKGEGLSLYLTVCSEIKFVLEGSFVVMDVFFSASEQINNILQ